MLVRFLKLLPVNVRAVPTESEAVNERAVNTSNTGAMVAVAAAVCWHSKRIVWTAHKRVASAQRKLNSVPLAAWVTTSGIVVDSWYWPNAP